MKANNTLKLKSAYVRLPITGIVITLCTVIMSMKIYTLKLKIYFLKGFGNLFAYCLLMNMQRVLVASHK